MKSIFSLKEKTIILVAHRLETLSSCDFVYSLAKGRIEKSFSKEEFSDYIKKNNRYLNLYEKKIYLARG